MTVASGVLLIAPWLLLLAALTLSPYIGRSLELPCVFLAAVIGLSLTTLAEWLRRRRLWKRTIGTRLWRYEQHEREGGGEVSVTLAVENGDARVQEALRDLGYLAELRGDAPEDVRKRDSTLAISLEAQRATGEPQPDEAAQAKIRDEVVGAARRSGGRFEVVSMQVVGTS
jgi:hypothetical protein